MEDVGGLFLRKAFWFLESLMKKSVDKKRCEATPTKTFYFSFFTLHFFPKEVILWKE